MFAVGGRLCKLVSRLPMGCLHSTPWKRSQCARLGTQQRQLRILAGGLLQAAAKKWENFVGQPQWEEKNVRYRGCVGWMECSGELEG